MNVLRVAEAAEKVVLRGRHALLGHDWSPWCRARLLLAVRVRVCHTCGKREYR